MLRMVKRLMALSLGVQRAQLEQRTGLTWPRPFLLRPLSNQLVTVPLLVANQSKSSLPFLLSGNVRRSRFSMYLEMYVVCASVGVIAEMSNGILARREGGFVGLTCSPSS
jgi:hypothetical protein